MKYQNVWGMVFGLALSIGSIAESHAADDEPLQILQELTNCSPTEKGTICGKILAPDGETPLTRAKIDQVLTDGSSPEASGTGCYSGSDGTFYCACANSGEALTFKATSVMATFNFTASCTANRATNQPYPKYKATSADVVPMAVVAGGYDHVEIILGKVFDCGTLTTSTAGASTTRGTLYVEAVSGYKTLCDKITMYNSTPPEWTQSYMSFSYTNGTGNKKASNYQNYDVLLKSADELAKYKAIFLDCGMQETLWLDSTIAANLKNYVIQGGTIYASDWAFGYLESAFPEKIEWYSADGSDGLTTTSEAPTYGVKGKYDGDILWDPKVGQDNSAQSAKIDDLYLKDFLVSKNSAWVSGNDEGGYYTDLPYPYWKWTVMTRKTDDVSYVFSAASLENGVMSSISDTTYNAYDPAAYPTLPLAVSYCDIDSQGGFFMTTYHTESSSEDSETVQGASLEFLVTNTQAACLQQAEIAKNQEPTPTEPEPTTTEPEPTTTEPEPTTTEPEPTPTEPEPTTTEPAPTPTEPEPTTTEPAPTPTEPAPTPTEPAPAPTEPTTVETQPAAAEPTAAPTEPTETAPSDTGTGTTSDDGLGTGGSEEPSAESGGSGDAPVTTKTGHLKGNVFGGCSLAPDTI